MNAPPDPPKWARSPQDFVGGLVLIAVAAFAFWEARNLPAGQGLQFASGTTPRLFASLLAMIGAVLMVIAFIRDGPAIKRLAIRGPLLVTAAVLFFAVAIRPMGIAAAAFITLLIAASASPETRWIETVVWAAVVTGFCILLFIKALGLPINVLPHFL